MEAGLICRGSNSFIQKVIAVSYKSNSMKKCKRKCFVCEYKCIWLDNVWTKFSQSLHKVCQKFAYRLHKVCILIAQFCTLIAQSLHTNWLHKVCTLNAQSLHIDCTKFAHSLHKVCSQFLNIKIKFHLSNSWETSKSLFSFIQLMLHK